MADRIVNNEANAKRIAFVEQCFGNAGQPLAGPGRILVGEGVLIKMCRKKPKPRQFFLFNDLLVYCNIVIGKKKYNKQRILHLENVRILSVPDDDDSELYNGFQVISPSKSFTVYAASADEKVEWMVHLQKCIDTTKQDRRVIVMESSPVWVPDDSAPVCMHCSKTEFTIINRRHHCRKCGAVCCAACTGKRWILPYQSSKPVRVCQTCYRRLRNGAAASVGVASMQLPAEDSSNSEDESPAVRRQRAYQTSFYD